jgi:UDP-N-acetylglucosamine 3-dehydrogenase
MSSTLNVGVIGAGGMGRIHSRCWTQLPGATVGAIADLQKHKAETLAAQIGGTAAIYDNADAVFADASIDVVSLCVPTDQHRALTEAALKAGKHVLCEKPMALSLEDCDAMIAAAQASGKLLTVGQVVRFFPEYANAKRLVDSGAVGAPAAVRVRRGGYFPRTDTDWFADPSRSGGVIYDLLVHDLDWLLWCFGPITRVYAHSLTERLADKTVDHLDYALLTMRHASGVITHAEATWSDPAGFATTWEIAGDEGLLTHDSRRAAPMRTTLRETEGGARPFPLPSNPLAPTDDPYYRQIAAFARAIQEGTPVAVTPEEARAAVAVAAAAVESARTSRAIEIS